MRGGGTDPGHRYAERAADRDALTYSQWTVWYMVLWGYLICCAAVFCTASGVEPPPAPEEQAVLSLSQDTAEALPEKDRPAMEAAPAAAQDGREEGPASSEYVNQLVQEILEEIYTPGMTEYEQAKAAYDWILDTAAEGAPVGFEIWRVHSGEPDTPIPYLENRALSVLRYHVGECEDMTGALVLLLRGMGMEAEYIPGLIFSLEDEPLDHAWAMARVDGVWYHMDPNLECYRSRRNTVRYLYFLKGDATMRYSHCWGEHIFYTAWLTAAQREEISRYYMGHPCPQDYAAPEARDSVPAAAPDMALLQREIDEEIAAYERIHGALAPIDLDIVPPVFGFEGYGPDIY